jgi:predicted permease
VEIAGVAPQNFAGLSDSGPSGPPSMWLPITAHPYLFVGSQVLTDFSQRDTQMFAKLKSGISLGAAEAQLASLTAELRNQHPKEIPAREEVLGSRLMALPRDALVPIVMVSVLVLLVLITACANLGNILLARGQAREREIDIRTALGAGAWRIVRQLMVENLLLACLGSAAGLAVGYFAAKTLLHLAEAAPGMRVVTDWRMVLAGAALALLSAAVFGLAPAIQAVRRGSTTTERGAPTRARRILVAVQVAASCFLLIFASLLARSAQRQLAIKLRYDYQRMVVLDPQLKSHNLTGGAARQALDEIAARLERVSGVTGVTLSVFPPFGSLRSLDFGPNLPRMGHNEVAPSYFAVMNLPLVRGRLFLSNERDVVVLSESAARAIWPDSDPLGKTLATAKFSPMGQGKTMINGREQRTVIGVVKDSQPNNANGEAVEVYLPVTDSNLAKTMLIVHVAGDTKGMLKDLRSAASLPGLAPSVWRMQSRAEQSAGPPPGVLAAIGSLGVTATLLAAIGIFGLMAFAVAQRTREIGLRIALGARPLDVLETLMAQYAMAMTLGAAAGLVLAVGFAGLFASIAYGFRPADPLSYLLGLGIFAVVALAAILIPARRALRIDPASALRWE